MKTRLLYLALALCTLCGCHQDSKKSTWIEGQVEGLDGSPLLVYGIDGFFDRIDTLTPNLNVIKGEIKVDTLVETILFTPDGREFPLFLEPNSKLKIEGSLDSTLVVSGTPANDLAYNFIYKLSQIPNEDLQSKRQLAVDFINKNPDNIASTYIIRSLILEADSTDWNLAKELNGLLSPVMRERFLMDRINNQLNKNVDELPIFSLPDNEGKTVSRYTFRGQWLLINFWASWDTQSRNDNKSIYRAIFKKWEKTDKLKMLGVSLDTDKKEWANAIKRDSIQWRQVCGRRSWDTDLIQVLQINKIPYNVLVDKQGKIVARNVGEEEIEKFIQKDTTE